LDKEIDGTSVLQALRAFFKENPELRFLHDRVNLEAGLPRLISSVNLFATVKQRMTAIATEMPALYEQSLFSGWMSALIGKRMGLSDDHQAMLFLSGFTHDIGMVLLQPELRNKKGELSASEYRQIQAHPIIGQKLLAGHKNMPKEVLRAVLEHHERTDGSGYPQGKQGQDLHIFGQIVGMTDTFYAAYRQHVQNGKGTLRSLIPILKMNSEAHFYRTYDAVVTVLKTTGLSEDTTLTDATMPSSVAFVRDHNESLTAQLNGLTKISSMLPKNTDDRDLLSLEACIHQASKSVRGSGILDEGYLRWLDQLEQGKLAFGYRELEDVVLMLKETTFQFKRVIKQARAYTEFGKDAGLKKAITAVLAEIDVITPPPSPPAS
jgi:hypothetical protein